MIPSITITIRVGPPGVHGRISAWSGRYCTDLELCSGLTSIVFSIRQGGIVEAGSKRIQEHLTQQITLLQRACEGYDSGIRAEALNIALRLRALFHDTQKSVSVAASAGIKTGLRMFDSALDDSSIPPDAPARSLLTWSHGNTFLPCLDDFTTDGVRPFLPFEQWWQKKVIRDFERREFSRRDLVLGLANQEGGAHVAPDAELKKDYAALEYHNSMQMLVAFGEGAWEPVTSPIPGLVRQIGYEALVSLADACPGAFEDTRLPAYYAATHRPTEVYPVKGLLVGPMYAEYAPDTKKPVSTSSSVPWKAAAGRNDPCPCGSGKKYKRCCGA